MSAAREQLAALLQEVLPYVAHRSDCPYGERSSSPDSDFCTCRVESLLRRARKALAEPSLLRAPQSGPWTYHPDEHGESRWGWLFVKDTFPHRRLWFDRGEISEDECIAIRDALNVVAGSGAETPPQPPEKP